MQHVREHVPPTSATNPGSGTSYFDHPQRTNYPARFYRLRSQ
jgi:hypothetical protein